MPASGLVSGASEMHVPLGQTGPVLGGNRRCGWRWGRRVGDSRHWAGPESAPGGGALLKVRGRAGSFDGEATADWSDER